jgi:hypothetical protein
MASQFVQIADQRQSLTSERHFMRLADAVAFALFATGPHL